MGFFVFCAKLLSIFANNTHTHRPVCRTETGAVKTALKLCTRASKRTNAHGKKEKEEGKKMNVSCLAAAGLWKYGE